VPLPALGTVTVSPVAIFVACITRLLPPPVTVIFTPLIVASGLPGFWFGFCPGFAITGTAIANTAINAIKVTINFFFILKTSNFILEP